MHRAPVEIAALALGVALLSLTTGCGRHDSPQTTAASARLGSQHLRTSCGRSATKSNFLSQVSAASAGETVCLASGDYGTWSGTNKAITVMAASGASPTMQVDFGSGDNGFTLSGIGGMGGTITNGASKITIKNSAFTGALVITNLSNANILLDHDSFNGQNEASDCNDQPARIHVAYNNGQTPSGVTVENSTFIDPPGGLANARDGIQTGSGMKIKNNLFQNIVDNGGCNHQDSIQAVNATGVIVVESLFANDEDGFVDFDASSSDTATDNACYNVTRPACVTLYSDRNSIVADNTARAGEAVLELNIKPGQADGEGTRFENNIGGVTGSGYRLGMDTHNVFTGATAPNINGKPEASLVERRRLAGRGLHLLSTRPDIGPPPIAGTLESASASARRRATN